LGCVLVAGRGRRDDALDGVDDEHDAVITRRREKLRTNGRAGTWVSS
jgi:hypothetical protein